MKRASLCLAAFLVVAAVAHAGPREDARAALALAAPRRPAPVQAACPCPTGGDCSCNGCAAVAGCRGTCKCPKCPAKLAKSADPFKAGPRPCGCMYGYKCGCKQKFVPYPDGVSGVYGRWISLCKCGPDCACKRCPGKAAKKKAAPRKRINRPTYPQRAVMPMRSGGC